jgi:hypothetical protein
MPCEYKDRELDRKLKGLDGKQVVAKGKLVRIPKDSSYGTLPPQGLYLDGHRSIEAAKGK